MKNSVYSFVDVESRNPKKDTILEAVLSVLRADNGACYSAMEQYILPPGVTGSKFFDQAYAVGVLLEYDQQEEKRIMKMREQTPGLNERLLWDVLQKALRVAGFKMRHGRLAGLLEKPITADDKSESNAVEVESDPGVDGQPDID